MNERDCYEEYEDQQDQDIHRLLEENRRLKKQLEKKHLEEENARLRNILRSPRGLTV